jgi:Ca2+-binding RTX toxin-like protein
VRNYNPRLEYTGTMDAWEEVHLAGSRVSLVGSDAPEVLRASGGIVRISGRGGDDLLAASRSRGTTDLRWPVVLRGGDGDDVLAGSFSDDRLVGGAGADRFYGTSGDDLLGGAGRDRLAGGKGRDALRGGGGRDRADGEAGRDTCSAEVRRSCER